MISPAYLGAPPRTDLDAPGRHIVTIYLAWGYMTLVYAWGMRVSCVTTNYEKVCLL